MGQRFEPWHQCFVQTIMSRGYLSGPELFRSVKSICEKYKEHQRFPETDTNNPGDVANAVADFVDLANAKLEPIQMHIVKRLDEVKGVPYKSNYSGQEPASDKYQQVYVLCTTYPNEDLAKLQKQYTEPELEWLKLVADEIIINSADHMARENEVVNCYLKGGQNAARKKLTASEALKVMERWIHDGYICKIPYGFGRKSNQTRIIMGTRFLLEMEPWILDRYKDDVNKCTQCNKVVIIYVTCPKCDSIYHRPCVDKPPKEPKCKKCKEPLKIEGVASKRS